MLEFSAVKPCIFAFILSLFTCSLLIPFVGKLAFAIGAVSTPGGRHIHNRKTPTLGGVAICAGFFAPLVGVICYRKFFNDLFQGQTEHVVGLFAGGVALCVLGIIDDTLRIRALHKLLVQIAIALFAYYLGFRIEVVRLPILGDISMGAFSIPLTLLWIVGIINAINLIDGLDGLAAGIVFFAGLTNLTVAVLSGSQSIVFLMCSMLGAVLGFLFYNFNPARIFMGDSGSYFLGFVLGTTSLLGSMQRASTAISLLVPVLALGIPIFDTLFAIVRRFLERRPMFSPDRGHLHHRLIDMGFTHRRAVLTLYAVSVVFTIAAIGVSIGRDWHVGIAILIASVTLIGIVRFAGYFEYLHYIRGQRRRLRTDDTERLRRVLPKLIYEVLSARREQDIWNLLEVTMGEASLHSVEVALRTARNHTPPLVQLIHKGSIEGRELDELVSTVYPLGDDAIATASITFRWCNDYGEVSPQCEVLLQVAVDVISEQLCRLESDLTRAAAPADEPTSQLVGQVGSIARVT